MAAIETRAFTFTGYPTCMTCDWASYPSQEDERMAAAREHTERTGHATYVDTQTRRVFRTPTVPSKVPTS